MATLCRIHRYFWADKHHDCADNNIPELNDLIVELDQARTIGAKVWHTSTDVSHEQTPSLTQLQQQFIPLLQTNDRHIEQRVIK